MLYQRTYLDKCATIVRGSSTNTGLNPVGDLLWGRNNSRMLVYFDHSKIKSLVEDMTYPDISKLHHRLRMTNAGSIDMSELHKIYGSKIDGDRKRRASSFDLIFFLVPEEWDNRKGFDYTKDYFNTEYYDKKSYDYELYRLSEGVNWFSPRNGYEWKEKTEFSKTTDGLFDFYIKSDTTNVKKSGDNIILTYYCKCGNVYNNTNLKVKQVNAQIDNPVEIGEPIYFTESGRICNTEQQKNMYCAYVKVPIKIKENKNNERRKFKFRIELNVYDKVYSSNQYSVMQNGSAENEYPTTDDGIYSTDTLEKELYKYDNGLESIIVGRQHFDIGCENIDVDITDIFNEFIKGTKENHGIGIAYSPKLESSDSMYENYIGILTNRTNTFFEPYVETIYDDIISDDRSDFVLGKENRLYLYSSIDGNLENLDNIPTCSIDGKEYEVKQASKGIYYATVKLENDAFRSPTMLYDTWGGITYQGENFGPVELEFTARPSKARFSIGSSISEKTDITPTLYGINDNEEIKRGDIRKICLSCRKDYTMNVSELVNNAEIRIYIMDGTAQVDVIPYMKMDMAYNETYFLLDTSILIPNTYYVDIRLNSGMEMKTSHDLLHFTIKNDANNRYV